MLAVVIDRYGDVEELQLRELPVPEPGPNRVRIRVICASINPVDWKLRSGHLRMYFPMKMPAQLGFDVAGIVDAVGTGVTKWADGDAVYARLETGKAGSYAEYCLATSEFLGAKPPSMSFADAAAVPLAALTALQSMRDLGRLRSGGRVLINGASGGVGTYAVQIGRAMEAHVTAVCSAPNHELVRGLGADACIDYRTDDFTTGDEPYDVVFDAVANKTFWRCRPVTKPGGAYVNTLISPNLAAWIAMSSITRVFGSRTASLIRVKPRGTDLDTLSAWIEDGMLKTITDSTFALADIRMAHERSQSGRARGKVVVRVADDP